MNAEGMKRLADEIIERFKGRPRMMAWAVAVCGVKVSDDPSYLPVLERVAIAARAELLPWTSN